MGTHGKGAVVNHRLHWGTRAWAEHPPWWGVTGELGAGCTWGHGVGFTPNLHHDAGACRYAEPFPTRLHHMCRQLPVELGSDVVCFVL